MVWMETARILFPIEKKNTGRIQSSLFSMKTVQDQDFVLLDRMEERVGKQHKENKRHVQLEEYVCRFKHTFWAQQKTTGGPQMPCLFLLSSQGHSTATTQLVLLQCQTKQTNKKTTAKRKDDPAVQAGNGSQELWQLQDLALPGIPRVLHKTWIHH